jgi:hypothetical protein
VEISPVRVPKKLIALALVPLLEPVALAVALSDTSPAAGALANHWLAVAPFTRVAALLTGGVATVVVIRRFLNGAPAGHGRDWGLLIAASFLSLMSIGTLDPAQARKGAHLRALRESDRIAQAIVAYARDKGHAPERLDELSPVYLRSPADPHVAGASVQYRRRLKTTHGYDLVIPCPGERQPLVQLAYPGARLDRSEVARVRRK